MFAIIDIETCGGKFEYRRGRITEICILRHDGLSVTDRFTTLINPDCHISSYFSGITGITNEMVADAPRFHEVAQKIIEMTEGCIFVAHNVGFDYNFIREEFASLGYQYKKETLCTVRLSRKLIPGRISYSLGHLCAVLGIEIFGRHRAEGDAVATATLFDLLIRLKTDHPQYRTMGLDQIMTRKVDKIKDYILRKLPEACGVYYFLNKDKEIIYVGKSTNMFTRAQSHFNAAPGKNRKMLYDLMNVDFVMTGSELAALLLEAEEIKKHKPLYNRMRKSEEFTHAIESYVSPEGVLGLRIVPSEESEQPLLQFNNYSSARQKLDGWIEAHTLCLTFCGLASPGAECFNHQIRKCNGICSGQEDLTAYNQRVGNILSALRFPAPDFLIFDKGRAPGEHTVILVENGRYYGFGYVDNSSQFHSAEDVRGLITRAKYYPDCDLLIRQFLNSGRRKIVKLNTAYQDQN